MNDAMVEPLRGRRIERAHAALHLAGDPNKRLYRRLIDIEHALVLRQVSLPVCAIEHPPHRRRKAERVGQHLEHQVPIVGPIAVRPQRSEGQ